MYVEVQDNAGNTGPASVSFTVDLVAPSLIISAPASNAYSNVSTVNVFWNATDANTGVQGYQYQLDSDGYSSISKSNSQSFVGLSEGTHTVYIKAYDNVNNVVTVSVTFMVDTVKPIVTVTSPTEAQLTNSSVVSWAGSDATSGILNYQSCVDGGAWSAPSGALTRTFALADGTHTVQVRAFDKAGNCATVFRNFTLDATLPSVVISAPANLAIFNGTSVTVNWNGTDNLAGIQGYQYKLDAAAYSGMIGADTFTFTGLSDALHTVIIKAIDNAGNIKTATIQFRVDTIAPSLSISSPGNNSYSTSASVTVSWSATDGGSGVQGYQYRIDGGAWSALSLPTVSHAFGGLLDGGHTVNVRAFDNGNKLSIKSVTFTVDTVAPTLVISNPVNLYITNSTSVTVFYNGTDATSGIQGYQYSLDGAGYSGTAAPIFHLFSGLSNALHYVNIKAVDKAGLTTIKRVNFTVDNVAPVLTISTPASGAYLNSSSVAVTWSATDVTTSISGYQYRMDGGAWSTEAMVLTNTFTGLSETTHTVEVRAFDQANNVRTVSVTFTVDITDPIVNITSPADRALVGSAVVTWTGSDATSGIQGYQSRIDNGTWSTVAMTFTRTFTGIPDGGHFVQVRAVDRSDNMFTVSVNLTLDATPPLVSITSPAGGYITNSTTVKVDWTGTDSPAGIRGYQYRIDAGGWSSESMTVTNTFSGLSDGLHTVDITAYDNAGNSAVTSITFRVDTIAPAVRSLRRRLDTIPARRPWRSSGPPPMAAPASMDTSTASTVPIGPPYPAA